MKRKDEQGHQPWVIFHVNTTRSRWMIFSPPAMTAEGTKTSLSLCLNRQIWFHLKYEQTIYTKLTELNSTDLLLPSLNSNLPPGPHGLKLGPCMSEIKLIKGDCGRQHNFFFISLNLCPAATLETGITNTTSAKVRPGYISPREVIRRQ